MTKKKTTPKVEAPKVEKVSDAIDINPHGAFIAGNTYTASIPAPAGDDLVFCTVNGVIYVPSLSEGRARVTFLVQYNGNYTISFTQGGRTIASKTLTM